MMADMKPEQQAHESPKYSCKEAIEKLHASNHSMKNFASVVHGYISLIRMDIEEGQLSEESILTTLDEMEKMLQKSYSVSNEMIAILDNVLCGEND